MKIQMLDRVWNGLRAHCITNFLLPAISQSVDSDNLLNVIFFWMKLG